MPEPPDDYTDNDTDVQRYLMNNGRQCPSCLLDGAQHELAMAVFQFVDGQRYLIVPCYCNRCRATWSARYRLEGIGFKKPTPSFDEQWSAALLNTPEQPDPEIDRSDSEDPDYWQGAPGGNPPTS
jgi:hypothetical protein